MFVRGKEEKGILGMKTAKNLCLFWLLEERRNGRIRSKMWHEKQSFDSPEHWQKELCRFVNLYNTMKPHRSLNGDTPFEILQAYFSQPVV